MNKDEADRCREMGFKALQAKDFDKAIRLFQKANKLHPCHENQSYVDLAIEKKSKIGTSTAAESNTPEESKAPKYTVHQEELCSKILSKENYYDILSVTKEAPLEELKRAYKKLALKLHPDKNHHPKATDAFKKVNKAFSCLSDETKRRIYDQTGTEETPMMGGPQNFDSMFAEHVFQQFFGESFFMPRQGFHHMHQNHQHRQENSQAPQRNIMPLLQLMPVILLILVSVISSYQTQTDPFSFHPTSSHSYEKYTRINNIRYYVEPSYSRELKHNTAELQKLEAAVEGNYLNSLRRDCGVAKEKKQNLLNKSNYYSGKQSKYYKDMANSVDLWSCDKLKDYVRV